MPCDPARPTWTTRPVAQLQRAVDQGRGAWRARSASSVRAARASQTRKRNWLSRVPSRTRTEKLRGEISTHSGPA